MDLNVQAFRIVQQATDEVDPAKKRKISSARRGGVSGGKARARTLTKERRKEISLKANAARWAKSAAAKEA
jgi:hypothetical protein